MGCQTDTKQKDIMRQVRLEESRKKTNHETPAGKYGILESSNVYDFYGYGNEIGNGTCDIRCMFNTTLLYTLYTHPWTSVETDFKFLKEKKKQKRKTKIHFRSVIYMLYSVLNEMN